MKHAELCPVCQGTGKITKKLKEAITAADLCKICHGCGGKGWVEISDDDNTQPQPAKNPPPSPSPFPYLNPWYPKVYQDYPYQTWYYWTYNIKG